MISLKDFNYYLPPDLIAQTPAVPRDASKLMIIDRKTNKITHNKFSQLGEHLGPNDVLVLNNTKVFPARIKGHKITGKPIEVLLLRQNSLNSWWAMTYPGLKLGNQLVFDNLQAKVLKKDTFNGQALLEFNQSGTELIETIYQIGQTPIPPYIQIKGKSDKDLVKSQEMLLRQDYQTVFAKHLGSAAAPTAGLHFTPELLEQLKHRGVQIEYITLHVGPGTFQRLWQENIDQKKLHSEWYEIPEAVGKRLIEAKKMGKLITAVGTTVTRTLESAYNSEQNMFSKDWRTTELFIYPPYKFKFVNKLITNFHLPESSLLMLVSAFTSQPQTSSNFETFKSSLTGKAYQTAVAQNYRFFSFGDAMLIQ